MSLMEMHVNGGPALLAMLAVVPQKHGRNVGRGAARAGAGVIRSEAQRLVRRRSGQLAKSLKLSSRIDGDVITAKVVARGPGSFTAPWIEYSVKPHWITVADQDIATVEARLKPSRKAGGRARATTMRYLNRMVREGSLVIGGKFVGPYVYHPGHKSWPFMRPALEKKGQEAINVMGEYMARRLTWNTLQAPAITVEQDEP